MKVNSLAALASASPEELERGNWKIVAYNFNKVREAYDDVTGVRHSWIDPAINIAKSCAEQPLSPVTAPEYTAAIGYAGERYLASVPHAMPLPAQFRWADLWVAMNVAMQGPKLSQAQFVNLQKELESLEMDLAQGQESDNTDFRIREIEGLMDASPWALHPDFGVLPKELASTEEVFQALVSLGVDASMGLAVETQKRLDREVLADLYVSSDGPDDWSKRLATYIGENELHKEPAPKFSLPVGVGKVCEHAPQPDNAPAP